MKAEIEQAIDEIQTQLQNVKKHFDWNHTLQKLNDLNQQAENPHLWDDQENAQKILKEREVVHQKVLLIQTFENDFIAAKELLLLAEEERDEETILSCENDLQAYLQKITQLQLETLLSGEADGNNCFLEVNAGAGGTEAQDWALMLSRMYTRWAGSKQYQVSMIDENPGDEAGIKSITMKISGYQAYGWLKNESGVHRLVRISPFDSNARRHTSFASVWVYPEIDDSIEIDIEEKDLRVDTYRASGAGGQHVNKTESAIRITHIPTNVVVQCQNDRSQHKNRAQAMKMLKARLYELELRKREEEANQHAASKTDIGWGHQIRSYVLQPYQLVKDTRTGVEKGNAHAVLEGDIDIFLQAALIHKIK